MRKSLSVLSIEFNNWTATIYLKKIPDIRNDLIVENKISLLEDNNMTHRKLAEKYSISLDAVVSIVKRRDEHISDYKSNQNKETRKNTKANMTQQIDEAVYRWFCSQRAQNIKTRQCSWLFWWKMKFYSYCIMRKIPSFYREYRREVYTDNC